VVAGCVELAILRSDSPGVFYSCIVFLMEKMFLFFILTFHLLCCFCGCWVSAYVAKYLNVVFCLGKGNQTRNG